MGKDLHAVIRMARWEVDECRRALAALHAEEDAVLAQQAALEDQHRQEEKAASADPAGVGRYFGAFLRRYLADRDRLAERLADVRRRVEQGRDALAEAYKSLKTYEQAQAARDRRAAEEEARKEQATLDEIGQTLYRRRRLQS